MAQCICAIHKTTTMYIFRVSGENHNTPAFIVADSSKRAIDEWMAIQSKAVTVIRCESVVAVKDLINTGKGFVVNKGKQ